jgi:hypothetical protein
MEINGLQNHQKASNFFDIFAFWTTFAFRLWKGVRPPAVSGGEKGGARKKGVPRHTLFGTMKS